MDVNEIIIERKKIKKEIKRFYKQRKNAIQLSEKYQELTNLLHSHGIHVQAKLDFLYPKFWSTYPKCFENHNFIQFSNPNNKTHKSYRKKQNIESQSILSIDNTNTDEKNKKDDNKNYYILNAACSFYGDRPYDFDVLTNYISSLELKLVKDDYNEYADKEEIIMGYEFFGTEDEFNILKKCVQKVCDMVKNDVDMDVYGNKRNY